MSIPKTPENAFCIRRPEYIIVKWDPVTKSITGDPITITSYRVYYSDNPNEYAYFNHVVIDTLNFDGTINAIYLDVTTERRYYKIQAVAGDFVSFFTDEVTTEATFDLPVQQKKPHDIP